MIASFPEAQLTGPLHLASSEEQSSLTCIPKEGSISIHTLSKGSPAKAAKPDYLDLDKDGNKEESMKEAAKDKKKGSPAKDMNKGYGQEVKSPMKMGHKDSPAKKYDRVVLGGNKGDKSKTKPGKKDYEK